MSDAGHLLDSSGLVALLDENHAHHEICPRRTAGRENPFFTCSITQGAVLRVIVRNVLGATFSDAQYALEILSQHPLHRFLPDDLAYSTLNPRGILGDKQVTDAYLAHLARHPADDPRPCAGGPLSRRRRPGRLRSTILVAKPESVEAASPVGFLVVDEWTLSTDRSTSTVASARRDLLIVFEGTG